MLKVLPYEANRVQLIITTELLKPDTTPTERDAIEKISYILDEKNQIILVSKQQKVTENITNTLINKAVR